MKEIIDTIVIIIFVFMLFMFVRGFNKEQVRKHKEMLDKAQKKIDN